MSEAIEHRATGIEIHIDTDRCRGCGQCALACGHAILRQEQEKSAPQIHNLGSCLSCGHCVAVCPNGALSHSDYPEGSVQPIQRDLVPAYDQLMELLRSRRSRRRFTDRPVAREDIEKVLEAARFAPSSHNEQSTEFIVVEGQEAVQEIAKRTVDVLSTLTQRLGNPIGRMIFRLMVGKRAAEVICGLAPGLGDLVSEYEQGRDYVLNHAPALILFCSDTVAQKPSENANIAIQNAALAAETLGLGCFYGGFVLLACNRDDAIQRFVSLPETHQVYGVLAVGHPRVKYRSWPERRPARVSWVGSAEA